MKQEGNLNIFTLSNSSLGTAWQSPSLYIGELAPSITEEELRPIFEVYGELESVKICRNWNTGEPLGYGFINYRSIEAATQALNELNYAPINGTPCRLMWSTKRSLAAVSEEKAANIYVKGLPRIMDNKALHALFSECGTVLSAKVARNKYGISLGYGYVSYTCFESGNRAINKLNGRKFGALTLCVVPFVDKQRRGGVEKCKYNAINVGQIPSNWIESTLELRFNVYGKIKAIQIYRDNFGQSSGYGLVEFFDDKSAHLAYDDSMIPKPFHTNANPIMFQPLIVTFPKPVQSQQVQNHMVFQTPYLQVQQPSTDSMIYHRPAQVPLPHPSISPVQYVSTRKTRANSYESATSASDFADFGVDEDLLGWGLFEKNNPPEKSRLRHAPYSETTEFSLGSDLEPLVEFINRKTFTTGFEQVENYFDSAKDHKTKK